MARPGQRQSGGARTDLGAQRGRAPRPAEQGIIPVLAEVAREVDNAVQRPPTRPAVRTKFQVVALLVREERARVMADGGPTESRRAQQLKRLDGVATLLARTAARDTSLLELLAEDARVSDAARAFKATVMRAGGLEPPEEPAPAALAAPSTPVPGAENQVVPRSVISRQLANPFLAPDFEAAAARTASRARRLAGWELLEPLFRSFEYGATGAPACMALPEPASVSVPQGLRADAAPGPGRRGHGGRPSHVPARRRARARQDRPGPARRPGGRRLSAPGRGAQRGEDELGARGRAVDPAPQAHGGPWRRRPGRRVRGHRDRQLRALGQARRLAR